MAVVHIVLGLALLEFFYFCLAVAGARTTYKVPPPATTGHEVFERYFRVQMNTLEQLVIFVPSILLFGWYVSPWLAALLGLGFIIGRGLYFRGYVRAAGDRHLGFMLSVVPNVALLAGGLLGALWALVRPALR
jgi:glutathione S-transferase